MRNFIRQDVYGKCKAQNRKCRKYRYRHIYLFISLSQSYFIDELSTAYAVALQRQDDEVERIWRDILLTYFKDLEGLNKKPLQLFLGIPSVGCGLDS